MLFIQSKSNKLIHDSANNKVTQNQDQISGKSHNRAFGTKIVKPSHNVVLGVELFYTGVQLLENFTLCDLNYFDIILGNTFLDAYEIDILYDGNKVKIRTKVGSKLMNLDGDYKSMLVKVKINLDFLVKELKSFSFMIFISLRISQEEPKPQGAR